MPTMSLADIFTGADLLASGATLGADSLVIPKSSLPSIGSATNAEGEEIAFCLVDVISDKVVAFNDGKAAADQLAYTRSTATEAAQGVGLVRKGYTFTFVMAHPFNENTAQVSTSP